MDSISFPELITERLVLRGLKLTDWPLILFLRSDKTINQYIQRPVERQIKTKADALAFIERVTGEMNTKIWYNWGITLKNQPEEIIGTICLWNFTAESSSAELGYDLHTDYHGKGIMTEALLAAVDFAFTKMDKPLVEAFTHVENAASIRMLEKNGFVLNPARVDENNEANRIFEKMNPLHL